MAERKRAERRIQFIGPTARQRQIDQDQALVQMNAETRRIVEYRRSVLAAFRADFPDLAENGILYARRTGKVIEIPGAILQTADVREKFARELVEALDQQPVEIRVAWMYKLLTDLDKVESIQPAM